MRFYGIFGAFLDSFLRAYVKFFKKYKKLIKNS